MRQHLNAIFRTIFTVWILLLAYGVSRAQEKPQFEIQTEHYVVVTDVDEDLSRKIGDYMETMYKLYGELLGQGPPKSQGRYRIEIQKDQEEFRERQIRKYRQLKFRNPKTAPHFIYIHYRQGDPKNVCCGFLLDDVPFFERLRHEGFHQYFRSIVDRPPQWLNEGMAEMIEGYDWRDGKIDTIPSRGRLRTMREGLLDVDPGVLEKKYDYVPIREVLTASKSDWLKTSSISYSESWAVCYFLANGPKENRAIISKILQSLGPTNSRPENTVAAMKAFSEAVDFEEFESDMLEYFRDLKPPGHEPFLAGQQMMNKRKFAEAIPFFTKAVEADDRNPRAFYFRASTYFTLKKFTEAEADLKRSISLFPEYSTAICVLGQVYVSKIRADLESGKKASPGDFEQAEKYLNWARKLGVSEKRLSTWFERMETLRNKAPKN